MLKRDGGRERSIKKCKVGTRGSIEGETKAGIAVGCERKKTLNLGQARAVFSFTTTAHIHIPEVET
jgi:hypothetical protein